MKAVILAGGFGTRISEESHLRPKPMIEIGGKPILWHIMKLYSSYGIKEFIICCGYKGYMIKEYFSNYSMYTSDITFDLANNHMKIHCQTTEPWKVTLVDTGEHTMTGGRLKRVAAYLDPDQPFCFTYGDGLADIDINKLVDFHCNHKRLATITAVRPPGRFGALEVMEGAVQRFIEKPIGDGGWINGGFFVLQPEVLQFISGDDTVWEESPLKLLVNDRQLMSYAHQGFWKPMDTLREHEQLEQLWRSGNAPWKKW